MPHARSLPMFLRSVALLSFYGSLAEGRPAGFELGEIPPDVNIAQAMAE